MQHLYRLDAFRSVGGFCDTPHKDYSKHLLRVARRPMLQSQEVRSPRTYTIPGKQNICVHIRTLGSLSLSLHTLPWCFPLVQDDSFSTNNSIRNLAAVA